MPVYRRTTRQNVGNRKTIRIVPKYYDLYQLDVVKWYKDDGVTETIPLVAREAVSEILQEIIYDLILTYHLVRLVRYALNPECCSSVRKI